MLQSVHLVEHKAAKQRLEQRRAWHVQMHLLAVAVEVEVEVVASFAPT